MKRETNRSPRKRTEGRRSGSKIRKVTLMSDGYYRADAVIPEALVSALQETIQASGVRWSMNLFIECRP